MAVKNKENDIKNYKDIEGGKISTGVLVVIAGLATTEVEGVASIYGGADADMIKKHGVKSLVKAIRVDYNEEDKAVVDVRINIAMDYSIPKVAAAIQERVASSIENLTGISVAEVNVKIESVEV